MMKTLIFIFMYLFCGVWIKEPLMASWLNSLESTHHRNYFDISIQEPESIPDPTITLPMTEKSSLEENFLTQVEDTWAFPYNTTFIVHSDSKGKDDYHHGIIGTGFMIGKKLGITAFANIWGSAGELDVNLKSVTCFFGNEYQKDKGPIAHYKMKVIGVMHSKNDLKDTLVHPIKSIDQYMALLFFEEDVIERINKMRLKEGYNNGLGCFSLHTKKPDDGRKICIFGYPYELENNDCREKKTVFGDQYESKGLILDAQKIKQYYRNAFFEDMIYIKGDLISGMCGAPTVFYDQEADEYRCIGILTGTVDKEKQIRCSIAFTPELVSKLQDWITLFMNPNDEKLAQVKEETIIHRFDQHHDDSKQEDIEIVKTIVSGFNS